MHLRALLPSLAVQLLAWPQVSQARAVEDSQYQRVGRAVNGTSPCNQTALPVCEEFTVPIHVDKTAPGEFSLENYNIKSLFAFAGRQVLVEADYDMSVRLCEPAAGIERKDTLQLLLHGATFSKIMWDFPYKPETYSWTRFMTNAGYTTLAVDFIGVGNSSKPDGLFEVHTETFVQTIHNFIQTIRAEGFMGRTYDKIAMAGFSVGSIVANSIADRYPDDADIIVLLGVTWDLLWVYPAFLSGMQTDAGVIDPERWGYLPDFYQTHPSIEAREVACFWGEFDEGALEMDFETRDMDTLGMAISFTYHLVTAKEFSGPVFLGIGQQDTTFCRKTCGSQPYAVYDRFPQANDHVVKVYENTGHALMYHHAAPNLYRDVQDFLDSHI
ncbi:alpha/beta-hydrolase [Sodiomyces alkalinus F11]|uniref:Alpha/beta-hydrolase n=1 Tax=Sodiomyces alkalinus (strain CBS 110278 / VKM F-3762 / F11) TaxID=1314773 RepID=A0A3N2PL74_SODAK|nr:alpha/beta-hydrolase [Sodiomyces alkalinus F11]ROT35239.1 alpha/beta-hydrolase [Sodiomyces alkalinus F11]